MLEPSQDALFYCPVCASSFQTRCKVFRHIDFKHVEHECDICLKKFPTIGAFQRHRDRIHNDGKGSLQCRHCESRFYLKCFLDEHMRNMHPETNDKRQEFGCLHCDSKFKSKALLMLHRRENHPDELAGCRFCGYTLINENALLAHIKENHLNDDNVYWNCPHCVKTFVTERKPFITSIPSMMNYLWTLKNRMGVPIFIAQSDSGTRNVPNYMPHIMRK